MDPHINSFYASSNPSQEFVYMLLAGIVPDILAIMFALLSKNKSNVI
jgi:hypothetical protein